MITWEHAVEQLRQDPGQRDLVLSCYYDDPLVDAAERFAASEEWASLGELLPSPGRVLDLGAGRGISSFAFAKSGWQVTALEPDPSSVVGAGAIRALSSESGFPIEVVEKWGEELPFADEHFDLVYGRAVFHHARDLEAFCGEAARVLKPGGRLLLTREHVLSKEEDLGQFFKTHHLHKLYGGEYAYTLERYLGAIRTGGFEIARIIGPKSSAVNFAPETTEEVARALKERRLKRIGRLRSLFAGWSKDRFLEEARLWEEKMKMPGRLYTFVAVKPGS